MSKHSPPRRTAALAMSAALLLGSVPVCAVDDGVTPTCDEAYYATTDYYGNLTEGSVVKSYTTNGIATLTDYGEYDEIVNLTNGLVPSTVGGKSVFSFDESDIPAHFYFEGKTAKPFEELPWTLSVHYTLNGMAARAEDLAGERGVVEITVDAMPCEGASEYARNNYTLEAMAIFNQDDILSLEAPGAQVQLVGNLRAVLFIGLPGEECHFTIRVGSDDFSFGGMTFLMVPATLSQLEEIAKLAERKDDLEENYDKLSASLDVLLDSMSGISSSLYATANGLDKLDTARGTISAGKGQIYADADALREDLDGIAAVLQPVSDQIDTAATAVSDSKAVLAALNEAVTALRDDLKELEELIDDAQDSRGTLEELLDHTAAIQTDLRRLESALDAARRTGLSTIDPLFGGMSSQELSAALTQVNDLHGKYTTLGGQTMAEDSFVQYALQAAGKSSAEASAVVNAYAAYSTCTDQAEVAEQAAANAVAEGLTDEDAIADYVTQAVTAWVTYNTVATVYRTAKGAESSLSFQAFLYANLLLKPNLYTTPRKTAENLYKLWQLNAADAGLTSLLIMEADDLNAAVESLNGTLRSTKSALDQVLVPTADVAGQLSALCGDMAELEELIDTADGFGTLGKSAAKKLSAVLDRTEELYLLLDSYEPELQNALTTVKELSVSAAATVEDTGTFLTDLEELLKTSGQQLDAGTKETLEGLAAALRATARSLNTTGDVKSAKNNIGSIIEDTWHEYTGEVNNLLLMDATAEAVSLTDTRNAAPQSIQVLIRTQEIKADSGASTESAAKTSVQTTFRQRVTQMLRDFWSAVTGIFKGKD